MTFTGFHEAIGCFGYFGVGSGFALVSEQHNLANEHCESVCPLREACHAAHHERIRSIALRKNPELRAPEAAETLELLVSVRGCAEVRAINFLDGISLAAYGTVRWYDEDTSPIRLPNGIGSA
jgi:hypothetical protein